MDLHSQAADLKGAAELGRPSLAFSAALVVVPGSTGHASIEVVWRRKQQTQTACVQFMVTRAVSIAITQTRRAATSLRRFVRGSPRGAAIATVSKNPRERIHGALSMRPIKALAVDVACRLARVTL